MKRNQPSSASARKATRTGRQTKLTHHSFGVSEQCPHCTQRFSSLQQLIDHVESAHLIGAIDSIPDDDIDLYNHGVHITEPLEASSAAEQHGQHQAQQQQQPTPQLQQQAEPGEQQKQQQKQTQWWKQRTADPVVAHVRYTSSSAGSLPLQPVRLSALSSIAPVELLLQFLPSTLANSLLTELLGQSQAWVAGSWWFGGQQQTAPRSSANYTLQAQNACPHQPDSAVQKDRHSSQHHEPPNYAKIASGTAAAPAAAQAAAAQAVATAPLNGQAVSTELSLLPQLPAPPALQIAADLISRAVSSRMSNPQHRLWQQQREAVTAQLLGTVSTTGRSRGKAQMPLGMPARSCQIPALHVAAHTTSQNDQDTRQSHVAATSEAVIAATAGTAAAAACLPQQQKEEAAELCWQPSYVLANFYRGGQQSVGSHTDRLSSLGPLPTIASVSLGAGRVFRLHPADSTVGAAAAAVAAAGGAGASSSKSSSSSSERVVSSIDIHLPHNSLLIMWPPTQEQWKHEVPKTKSVTLHPLSGPARINLTFRQLQPAWAAAVPQCRCARPAIMRCGLQGGSFVYYYACDNTQGPGCGLHKAAVTLKPAG